MEKAGGTTLHHIFRNNDLAYINLAPRGKWKHQHAGILTPAEAAGMLRALPFTKGVGGHSLVPYADYESAGIQFDFVTFLREPLSRCLSQYRYQCEVLGMPYDADSYLADEKNHNLMTKRIAGSEDLGRALDILNNRFVFVGVVERFDESLLVMRQLMGRPDLIINYEAKNVAKERKRKEPLDLESGEVRKINSLDIELYKYVKTVLFPSFANQYQGDLQSDLQTFRKANQNFRFSRLRRLVWGGYKYLIYSPIEKKTSKRMSM